MRRTNTTMRPPSLERTTTRRPHSLQQPTGFGFRLPRSVCALAAAALAVSCASALDPGPNGRPLTEAARKLMMPLKDAACPILTRTSMRRRLLGNMDNGDYFTRENFVHGDKVKVDAQWEFLNVGDPDLWGRIGIVAGEGDLMTSPSGIKVTFPNSDDANTFVPEAYIASEFLQPIVDHPDDEPGTTAVYVSGADNAPDHDQVNGWYLKKNVSQQTQPRNWKNKRNKFDDVRAVDHFYENSNGYFIYREKLDDGTLLFGKSKLKRCTKCDKIVYSRRRGKLPKQCRLCGHGKSGEWFEEADFHVWYICGPDGQPRYMHRHQQPSINQLTRNKWKAFNKSAPDDDLLPKKKHVRQDQNLRVVEYPN